MSPPFTPAVVAAIVGHMNSDHADDSRLICQTLGGEPAAEAAHMVDVDETHAVFAVSVDGRDVEIRIPWSAPVTERSRVREEIVGMYRAACGQAGITPRGEHE